ncbi:MAG: hypothetical protein A2Y75_08860 [Candidatus Solincola sediminis]|uniref:AMP-dependent synthetase/ligase domain-containing protein n=1 Tax=Candidatus Solincola sediminis TaxID=1797199 RepID=A0A1F2WIJ9_9ACTN|nr:MAG: hypothetical protein A2Y75_08860 [Candidatus Solincola sediminis]
MKNAKNVWQCLANGVMRSQQGLTILEENGKTVYRPQELLRAAMHAAAGLHKSGVIRGDRVGILAQTTPTTVLTLLGCWALGAVPVPLPLPMRAMDPRAFIEQSGRRLQKVRAKLLVIPGNLIPMVGDLESTTRLVAAEDLCIQEEPPLEKTGLDETALIQFTSGSTSDPRGVVLSNRAIIANSRAICKRVRVGPKDTILSWMPLYHDMGLIGFFITALSAGCSLILMPPQRFAADPSAWLRALSDYRATITGGPNFSYALSSRILKAGTLGDIDLSSLRLALNGAEPVDAKVLDEFIREGRPYGLKETVPYPVYGLAEATLAVTFPNPGKRYRIDRAPAELDRGRSVVSVGTPLSGIEVRIVKADGEEAMEREVGEVCVRGASVMQGYWEDEQATARVLRDGWLCTGDLGYIDSGELFLVGRIKEMMIVGGRNLFPEDVERCAEQVQGIRKGNTFAFGITTPRGRERLVLVSETRFESPDRALQAAHAVSSAVRREIGVPVREVVLVRAGSLPKTSSGKKRRFLCRDLYLDEKLHAVASSRAAVPGN